jgi:hypothetical protein
MALCTICGGELRETVGYTARRDRDGHMMALPSYECTKCGAIRPDSARVVAMPAGEVPSGVRIRCALPVAITHIPAANWN